MDFIPKEELREYRYEQPSQKKRSSFGVFLVPLLVIASIVGVSWVGYGYHVAETQALKRKLAVQDIPQKQSTEIEPVYGVWPELSNPDFFSEVKQSYQENGVDFIEANLSEMAIRIYKEGKMVATVPIKTKGREGSWWETPSGLYQAETIEKNHFSSLGKVYMPYSIQFQGNFYIHGWPYYPDGTPVASTYSGGCVRLSDEDAKIVYDHVTKGMPILVYENDFVSDEFAYEFAAPELSATSYLAVDLQSNFVLLSANEESAQTTYTLPKVMTGLIASEYRDIENKIVARAESLVPTSVPRLSKGSLYSIYDLLYPLVLESSAEAAEVIADTFSEAEYKRILEKKMKSLGIGASVVTSPSGWEGKSVSTASDMFKLAKYLYNNRPFLLSLSSTQRNAYSAPQVHATQDFSVSGIDGFVGAVIAGSEASPEVVKAYVENFQTASAVMSFAQNTKERPQGAYERDGMAVFEIEFQDQLRPVAFIVLGSTDPDSDIEAMHEYVYSRYH